MRREAGKKKTIGGPGSHAEDSSIHLFNMCVPMVSQAFAWYAGFKNECSVYKSFSSKRAGSVGRGSGRNRSTQAQVCTRPKCSGKQKWVILARFCSERRLAQRPSLR